MKKIFIKLIALVTFVSIFSGHLYSQRDTMNFYPGLLWVTIADSSAKPNENNKTTLNSDLNQLFSTYKVTSFKQVMPFANTPQLRNIYEIKCDMDEYEFLEQLNSSYSKLFSNIELRPKPKLLYNPPDWMWSAYIAGENDWLWYLDKIQADQAWNITKGNPNVKIAVIDNGVDSNHPDIIGKINPNYDFYTGGAFTVEDHGTSVVSLLAGETVEQGQTPNGIQASIGFNSKVMFAGWGGGTAACLYASTVLHAKIISISWYYSCSPNVTDLLIEQEILNNGTSIIKAAGNGPNYCGGGLLYPFSGLEDDRTIIVSSTDKNDNHEDLNPGTVATVSHYPQVDICAPGYELMAATPSSSWLYTTWGGTSQSTPIVAGVAALMLSVNQCMESTDIQTIIKQTADPITDALNYPGTVGAGRINAYKAVSLSQYYGTTPSITVNETWTNDKFVKGVVNIESGYRLTITGKVRFAENAKIIVKQGAKLIIDGGKITSACSGSMWKGIEVWGTENKSQLSTDLQYQGQVEIKNGGTIENAEVGVYLGKRDNAGNEISGYGGGLLKAKTAVFRNNKVAVEFRQYFGYLITNPATHKPNYSYITYCTFETNSSWNFANTYPDAFVKLNTVDGITFSGCTFQNTAPANFAVYNRGKGIVGEDAFFIFNQYCASLINPCTNLISAEFKC